MPSLHPARQRSYVVALAAHPGAGKSTVARHLADALPGSCLVAYDDFQQVTRMSAAELEDWEKTGFDCDRFDLTTLERELQARKDAGFPIVVFETPLGRAHRGTSRFIDYLAWLDTPLDVALSRALLKVLRTRAREASSPLDTQHWLESYLLTYQRLLFRLYRSQAGEVRTGADVVLDGLLAPYAIADALILRLIVRGIVSATDHQTGVER